MSLVHLVMLGFLSLSWVQKDPFQEQTHAYDYQSEEEQEEEENEELAA